MIEGDSGNLRMRSGLISGSASAFGFFSQKSGMFLFFLLESHCT